MFLSSTAKRQSFVTFFIFVRPFKLQTALIFAKYFFCRLLFPGRMGIRRRKLKLGHKNEIRDSGNDTEYSFLYQLNTYYGGRKKEVYECSLIFGWYSKIRTDTRTNEADRFLRCFDKREWLKSFMGISFSSSSCS